MSESQVDPYGSKRDLFTLLAAGFGVGWSLTGECEDCYTKKGGMCSQSETNRQFICSGKRGRNWFSCLYFLNKEFMFLFYISYLILSVWEKKNRVRLILLHFLEFLESTPKMGKCITRKKRFLLCFLDIQMVI